MKHLHLADRFMACFHEGALAGAVNHLHHRPPVVEIDPAVVRAWAEWMPPWQWEARHGGRGES